MEISKVNINAGLILTFLHDTDLKPDEKIAALDTASATIRAVIAAESLRVMWASVLNQGGNSNV